MNHEIRNSFGGVGIHRRNKLEIICKILDICKLEGSTKTRIVYQANLNFRNASIYIDWLINREFLVRKGKIYLITSKGQTLLAYLTEIALLMKEDSKGKESNNRNKQ